MFKRKEKLSDQALISGLTSSGVQQQRYENYLFDTYSYLVKHGSKKHSITEEEALIAYSDAALVVINNIRKAIFKEESTIKTYLTGIFFRKCVNLIRKKTTKRIDFLPIDDFYDISDNVKSTLENIVYQENVNILRQRIRQLGGKCRTILEKWVMGYSDKEIAAIEALGFKNTATVKGTRYRCLKKLKEK